MNKKTTDKKLIELVELLSKVYKDKDDAVWVGGIDPERLNDKEYIQKIKDGLRGTNTTD